MPNKTTSITVLIYHLFAAIPLCMSKATVANTDYSVLEEVTVTAEKREKPLQKTPIALSVLGKNELAAQGVNGLADLMASTVTSLHAQPFPDDPGSLVLAIRGNGPGDVVQITRDASVAVYTDEFYLGRAQGLYADLVDPERIEVLRGPQGALFGRNATGGAISIVSNKPAGEWKVKQTFGVGRYNERRSLTHVDLPAVGDVSAKLSYHHAERDGWVDNTAADERDYNEYKKDSGRLAISWNVNSFSTVDYFYNRARVEASQIYFQIVKDNFGYFGDAIDGPNRQTKTRFPIAPLDPTESTHDGHGLTLTVELSDSLTFKSLTAYNELEHDVRNNYGGALYFNGLIFKEDIEQRQKSQEFRLVGSTDRLEYVTGLYYYYEQANEGIQKLFSLDIFGDPRLTGTPLSLINPPTTFDALLTSSDSPQRNVNTKLNSIAVYGQVTWTPPVLADKLKVSLGLRHTKDDKNGDMSDDGIGGEFDLNYTHTNPALTFDYQWTDYLMSYIKWSTAFRGGGVSSFSSFSRELQPFKEEEVSSYEVGLKSEYFNRRLRFNFALFQTDYDGMIIDIFDPDEPEFAESINARRKVEIDGVELEASVIPFNNLMLGFSYTYLDGNMPLQPNPLNNDIPIKFRLSQTPRHSGAVSLDYTFRPFSFGDLSAHLDVTSTSGYHYYPTNAEITDAYTLMNTRITLSGIELNGGSAGKLAASLWVNNITDEEYAVFAMALSGTTLKSFGTPRTFGADITYQF